MKAAAISLSIAATMWLVSCNKRDAPMPVHTHTILQGTWQFQKYQARSWKNDIRIGGGRVYVDRTLQIDSLRYAVFDDWDSLLFAGRYELDGRELLFYNDLDSTASPTEFYIRKLNREELQLVESGDSATRFLGDVHTEGVHFYER